MPHLLGKGAAIVDPMCWVLWTGLCGPENRTPLPTHPHSAAAMHGKLVGLAPCPTAGAAMLRCGARECESLTLTPCALINWRQVDTKSVFADKPWETRNLSWCDGCECAPVLHLQTVLCGRRLVAGPHFLRLASAGCFVRGAAAAQLVCRFGGTPCWSSSTAQPEMRHPPASGSPPPLQPYTQPCLAACRIQMLDMVRYLVVWNPM